MKPSLAPLSLILLLGFGGWQLPPDPAPTASAGATADTVTVGSPFVSILRISAGKAVRVTAGLPSISDDMELTDSVEVEAGTASGEWRVRYPLVAWRTGELRPIRAPLTITWDDGTSQTYEIALELPFVASVLPRDTSGLAPREQKGILVTWRESFPWWIPIVGIVLLLAGVAVAWRRRWRLIPEMPVVTASARDRALAKLSSPGLRELIDGGDFGEAYARISDIVRSFLLEVDARWTLDLTTTELIGAMSDTGVPSDQVEQLRAQLGLLDQVKFARTIPSHSEAVVLVEDIRGSVARWI